MNALVFDFRHAIRGLKKDRGVTAVVLLTLALGIGANAAIFCVFDAVLLRPLPFVDPDQLVRITADFTGPGLYDVGLSAPELEDYRRLDDSFETISALFPINLNLTEVDQPERIEAMLVDPSYFSVLGVEAQLGRVFREDDFRPGVGEVAVVSDGLWRRRFGGDPHIIGRKFRLDEDWFTIVGVSPAGFRHPGPPTSSPPDLWVPCGWLDTPFPNPPVRTAYFFQGALARLRPGVSASSAEERLRALARELRREHPDDYPEAPGWAPRVIPLERDVVGDASGLLLVLLSAAGVVLLMVCANVASLLLVRGAGRGRELALRRALGASGTRVTIELFIEAFLLSVVGGALGAMVGSLLLELVVLSSPETFPRISEITIDGRILLFTVALSVGAGLLFGTAPALRGARTSLLAGLKEGTTGGSHNLVRSALVAFEYSLAAAVMVGAVLLGRSLWQLARVDLGFETESVVTVRLWLPSPNIPESGPYFRHDRRALLVRALLQRASVLPGVEEVALTTLLPLDGQRPIRGVEVEGSSMTQDERPSALSSSVSSRYFDAMTVVLARGRSFTDADDERSLPVVIVSRSFATRYFPGEDPIGRRIRPAARRGSEAQWRTIVGIVEDVKVEGLEVAPRPHIYTPLLQESGFSLAFVIRGRGEMAGLVESLSKAVRTVDSSLPLYAGRTMAELVARGVGPQRFATSITAGFSLAGLLLAGLGVYGVTSYSVRRRTREIGIRMALGEEPSRLKRLVVRQAMGLVAVGAVAGLMIAALLTKLLQGLLFGVSPTDPMSYALVLVLLGVSGLGASFLPARRAALVDPLTALRHD